MHTRAHAHTHPFYGSLDFIQDYPGEPAPEKYNLSGFTGARNSEWQWYLLDHMQMQKEAVKRMYF